MNLSSIARQHGFKVQGRVGLEQKSPFPESALVKIHGDFSDKCDLAMTRALRAHWPRAEAVIDYDRQIDANMLYLNDDKFQPDDSRQPYINIGFYGHDWEMIENHLDLDDAQQYQKIPVEIGLAECQTHPCSVGDAHDMTVIAKGELKDIDELPHWLAQHVVKVFQIWLKHAKDPKHGKRV